MRLKRILLSSLVVMGCLSASAQEPKPLTEDVFVPHFYVQVQPVGAQYTLGEVAFKDLLSYNVQVAGGYEFNPVFGLRLAVNAWQSRGGWETHDNQVGKLKWKYYYVAPTVDATVNLTNLLCGYKAHRLFNLTAFAGIGANIAWNNDEAAKADAAADYLLSNAVRTAPGYVRTQNLDYLWKGTKCRFVAQFGASADFRITDAVSVGVEVNCNTLSDRYNSKRAGNADWYFNALLGAKFNIGQTHTTREVPVAPHRVDTIYLKERIVERAPATVAPVVEQVPELRRDIFFTIRATQVVGTENNDKVKEVADYLKKYPTSKVSITGYADKGTGNVTINNNLSQKRAKVVADLLKNKYGIDASRITTDYKGHFEQPFAENDKNRVTICIAK